MSGRAFRAQLVTPGQRELFDYWRLSAGPRTMPARADFDPLSVPRLLPHIGLIDVRSGIDHASFRLAGTQLHSVYGQEITGKRVADVFCGVQGEYWGRIHGRVAEQGRPAHGVIQGPVNDRDHVVLFWLRLPFSSDGLSVDTILCLDVAAPSEHALPRKDASLIHYPTLRTTLRAQAQRAHCC